MTTTLRSHTCSELDEFWILRGYLLPNGNPFLSLIGETECRTREIVLHDNAENDMIVKARWGVYYAAALQVTPQAFLPGLWPCAASVLT